MKAIVATFALLAAPLVSPVALAQSDGTLGSSSTGTLNFNVNISDANRIQISGFSDMAQTVRVGVPAPPRPIDQFANGSGLGEARPCITADLPDTTVSLDWEFTPMTDVSDDTNIIPVELNIRKNVDTYSSFGGTLIVSLNRSQSVTPQMGTVTGLETKTGEHGIKCDVLDPEGVMNVIYFLGRTQRQLTLNTAGTYVSTVKFTVKPE